MFTGLYDFASVPSQQFTPSVATLRSFCPAKADELCFTPLDCHLLSEKVTLFWELAMFWASEEPLSQLCLAKNLLNNMHALRL